jgi:hypothetical protein
MLISIVDTVLGNGVENNYFYEIRNFQTQRFVFIFLTRDKYICSNTIQSSSLDLII